MPKVSVIIPVFNTEKYLRKCLDSVCNQTLSDIEIICIDDCSTDDSLNILKEYALKDNRIKLIEFKENKGAAVARNLGIDEAKGEYIGFIDSDDYPETELFYEHLYNNAKEKDADISKGAYKDSETGYIDETINAKILENKNNFCSTYCSAIFRNDFIKDNNIKFPELRDMEDPVFAFKCALKANKVEVVPECNLIITKRDNSITSKVPTIEQIKDKIKGLKLIFDLGVEKNQSYVLAYWLATIVLDTVKNNIPSNEEYLMYYASEFFNKVKENENFVDEFCKISPELYKYFVNNKNFYYFDKDTLKRKIDTCDVISFDVFDTLLLRPFVVPTDIFSYIEKYYNKPGFAVERIIAEKKARLIKQFKNKACEDITYEDIYNKINSKYKDAYSLEKEFEYQILQANNEMLDIYNYALAKNKKIIITSDMYLDSEFLAKVLNKNGYFGFEKIYVSSEIGLCKGSGNIFKYILNELKIQPQKLLHLGDNHHSDFNVPKENKISSFYYRKISERYFNLYNNILGNYYQNPNNHEHVDFSSVVGINIIREYNSKTLDYWEKFGYILGGPLGTAYVASLVEILKCRDISDIFFIARDGYLLKEIFDKLYPDSNVKSHYIYASRKLNKLYFNKHNEKNEYNKYISSIKTKGDNILIADTCTGVYSAQGLLEEYLPNKNFLGIYMTSALNYKYNYINLSSKRNTDYNDLGFLWDIVEFLFTSFELPIEDMHNSKPIYRTKAREEDLSKIEIYKKVYKGIKRYIDDYKNIFEKNVATYTTLQIFNFIKYFWQNKTNYDNSKLSEVKHPVSIEQDVYISLNMTPYEIQNLFAKVEKNKR